MKLWAFGYAELAALWGVSEAGARSIVSRGLDPGDLAAVVRETNRRRGVRMAADGGVMVLGASARELERQLREGDARVREFVGGRQAAGARPGH